ncbi:hypothetical protein G6514_001390 [Epicoccum nigrum]|nr:hypothetical protein G6514_001390 [Epicoccum nigrum]
MASPQIPSWLIPAGSPEWYFHRHNGGSLQLSDEQVTRLFRQERQELWMQRQAQRHANTSRDAAGPSRAPSRAPSQTPFPTPTQPIIQNFGLINHGMIQHTPLHPGGQQWLSGHIQNLGGYQNDFQANFGGYNQPLAFAGPAPQAIVESYNQPFVSAPPTPQSSSGNYSKPFLFNSPATQATVGGYNQPYVPAPPVQQDNPGGYNHITGRASPAQQPGLAVGGASHVSAPAGGVAAEIIDLTGESSIDTPTVAPPETPRAKADSSFWKKGSAHLLKNCFNTYSRSDPWYLLESMRSYPHSEKRAQYCERHWPNEEAAEQDIAEKSKWFLDAEELFTYDLKWNRLLTLAQRKEPSEAEALDEEIFAEQAMLAKQLKEKREAKREAEDLAQKKDCLDKMSPKDFKKWYSMPKNVVNVAQVMEKFGADVLKERGKTKASVKKMDMEEAETQKPSAPKKRRTDSFQNDAESPASKRPRPDEGPASLPQEASPVDPPEPAPEPGSENTDGELVEDGSDEEGPDEESSNEENWDSFAACVENIISEPGWYAGS